jgi:hypothetical protein
MRGRRRGAVAALLAVGLLVPACGSEGGGPATTAASGGSTTVASGEALVTYSRTGGVAGVHFSVVVQPDGTFEGGSGKPGRGHLGGAALEELRGLVDAFLAAAPEPSYGRVVPDGFTTTVTAGDRSTSVLAEASPPAPVLKLLGFLAGLERQMPR